MRALQALAIALTMLVVAGANAFAQQPHWLLGTWEGEVRGLGNNPTGTKRAIIVRTVSPDGAAAQATWRTEAGAIGMTMAINGDVVSFTPPSTTVGQGNHYKLTRQGNVLEGTWSSNTGRSGGVSFNKK